MSLSEIKDIVSAYSEAISKVLETDVVIVDKYLQRVGNTHYYPNTPVPITNMSIIGQVVESGKVITLEDKSAYFTCKKCTNLTKCQITGFIGVPIFGEGEIIGGICLLITNKKKSMFLTLKNHIDFLEKMAELLAAKYISILKYNELQESKREQEFVMNAIESSIALTDNDGVLGYYNRKFAETFGISINSIGMNIKEIINDKLVDTMLDSNEFEIIRLMYYRNPHTNKSFYGFAKCISKINAGEKEGNLFYFKSFNQVSTELNEVSDNKTSVFFGGFVSQGYTFKQIVDRAKRLSVLDEIIFICGEHGTEKDIMAKAIHNFSNRSNGYFVTLDCDTSTSDNLEEELFGSDKFILSKRIGKLQLSHKGTLFIRLIEEMPLYVQEKLANFLKTGFIKNSYSNEIGLDVRLICSSNIDLFELVKNGLFNEDLYYRISQNTLLLPPLRCYSRNELSQTIATYSKISEKFQNKNGITFSHSAIDYMYNYEWNENIMELQRCINTLVFKYAGEVTSENIMMVLGKKSDDNDKLKSIQEIEKFEIEKLIGENKSKAEISKILNIGRATLYRKIKKYSIAI